MYLLQDDRSTQMNEHTTNIQNNSLLDNKNVKSQITICTDENIFYIKVQNYPQLQLYKPFELRYSTLLDTYNIEHHNYK